MKCGYIFLALLLWPASLIDYVSSGRSHQLPSGEILYMKLINALSYEDAVKECSASFGGVLVETPTKAVKDEVMEFLKNTWSPDTKETWLGAYKIFGNRYFWNSTHERVNETVNPFDSMRLTCRSTCCNLKLLPWGTIYGVPCKDPRETARSLCLWKPMAHLNTSITKEARNLYWETDSRQKLQNNYCSVHSSDYVHRLEVLQYTRVIRSRTLKVTEKRLKMEPKILTLSKDLSGYDEVIASLKSSNTALFSLLGLCFLSSIIIFAFNVNMLIVLSDKS